MAGGIEIHEDVIQGLVPELKNIDTFRATHHLASENNPLLHLFHETMMKSFGSRTNYTPDILQAIDLGVRSYEALSITHSEEIPVDFALGFIARREKTSNFGIELAEALTDSRTELLDTEHSLALGVFAICATHLDSDSYASTYSIGGAAIAHTTHQEVRQMWQLERDAWTGEI